MLTFLYYYFNNSMFVYQYDSRISCIIIINNIYLYMGCVSYFRTLLWFCLKKMFAEKPNFRTVNQYRQPT